jgi:hypothetical protein
VIPLAHAGHWIAEVIYVVPVVVIVTWISIRALIDRRRVRREQPPHTP